MLEAIALNEKHFSKLNIYYETFIKRKKLVCE